MNSINCILIVNIQQLRKNINGGGRITLTCSLTPNLLADELTALNMSLSAVAKGK